MFTGIITGIGKIVDIDVLMGHGHGKRLTLQAPLGYLDDVMLGDSIALNGACMTVTTLHTPVQCFTVDISAHSLQYTTGLAHVSQAVNLEKALRPMDRFGGHWVSGHIDGVAQVSHFEAIGESWELRIQAPLILAKFLARKGSVAINGVSLTINSVFDNPSGCEISLNLIAHTWTHTTLGQLQVGQAVNLEVDQMARQIVRYCELSAVSSVL
jgi:riboflavin synthase